MSLPVRPPKFRLLVIVSLSAAGLLLVVFYTQHHSWPTTPYTGSVELGALEPDLLALPNYDLDPDVAYNLGPYSPRYAVPSDISSSLPEGCVVSMISILQRHGARHPTSDAGRSIEATLEKLTAVRTIANPLYKFIPGFATNYTYSPGQLVSFGETQSYISGQIIAKKYGTLGPDSFVRASGKDRIVRSSQWWRQGFEGRPSNVPLASLPSPHLIIPIGISSNNTLGIKTCVAAEVLKASRGHTIANEWLKEFAPGIAYRLNVALPGAGLMIQDIANLMSLCGFDTAARNGTQSPWCKLFKYQEWLDYEYYHDLEKYYSSSYGSAFAPSEGVGWVNELLSRLTGTAVRDNTTTNSTLDNNFATFPFGTGAPRIFADFSSDNNIAKILSAMGLLHDPVPLPRRGPAPLNRKMVISKIVPFAGCTVVEKVTCSIGAIPAGDYVRVVVNDAIVPIPLCESWIPQWGLCTLDEFASRSQNFSRSGVDVVLVAHASLV